MTSATFDEREERPVEVRVYRHGALVHRELCESEEQASSVAEHWSELNGTECEVDDLSAHHRVGDILEPAPAMAADASFAEEPGIGPSGSIRRRPTH